MRYFQEIDSKKSVDASEKEVLEFWERKKIFQKSLKRREGAERYSFYDGPPFATGTPHYGHLVASAMKDVVPRYWTMRGKYVERRWGWDCHGLPIENIVEKEMGSQSKKDIEAIGIGEFNERCRANVLGYVDEWRRVISRFGRWADMDDAYRTMDPEYMESVWAVFADLWEKGLIYEGYRSMHICPRCETTLSQSEVAEGYKDIKDLSVTVKFEIIPHCPSGAQRKSCRLIILDEKGRILTGKEKKHGNYEGFPGGHLEQGETWEDAAKREAKEELGVDIEVTGAKFLHHSADGKVRAVIVARIVGGEIAESEEVGDARWNDIEHLVARMDSMEWITRFAWETYTKGKSVSLQELQLIEPKKTFILAWTTTPWTLLGNVALAVGKDIVYQVVSPKEEMNQYFLAKERVGHFFEEGSYEVIDEFLGSDFLKMSYKPLFDNFSNDEALENRERGWKVCAGDFVTTEDGTGVVHIAPAFGTDDMHLGKTEQLPFVQHIGMDGIFSERCGELAGLDVKPRAKEKPDEVREADIAMLKKLKETNAYFSHEKYLHSYPHCWRCDTALLNYATSSWFVAVEKMKEQALENAKDIHWVPEHIKEGRFGKWLEGARDWSISRQRFWASVMPIWRCKTCSETRVVGDVMDIAEELGGVNRLYLVRHGEAVNNVKNILDSKGDAQNHLTDLGREEASRAAQALKNKKIDIVFTSPLVRTKETAEILREILGASVVEDERLRETGFGSFDGKSAKELRSVYPTLVRQKGQHPEDETESLEAIRKRIGEFLEDIHRNFSGKNIVIVSHADTIVAIHGMLKRLSDEETERGWYPKHAEIRSVFSKPVDLHRPYIDEVKLACTCGGGMTRISDVLDTWFDSGSMPYAQMHYPFENEEKFTASFPADFIAEGVDQTRCWFYYLHILATGTKNTRAFQNVIVNGIVQAEDGKKMSKKLKNYPDPSIMMEKYGSDVLRLYLLGSPVVMAENLNFSERELGELSRGMFRMLRNTYAFFVMYATVDGWESVTMENGKRKTENKNLLDKWILSEFNVLVKNVNEAMEKYELARAVRYFAPFVDDLSNWYVRRSRRRFWKSESDEDKQQAYETLYGVLLDLAKLLAPFAPFVAEEIYGNLRNAEHRSQNTEEEVDTFFPPLQRGGGESASRKGSEFPESVHLCEYPQSNENLIDEKAMKNMRAVREIVTLGLQKRAEAKIKVRQPLSRISLGSMYADLFDSMSGSNEGKFYYWILQEELNVKNVGLNVLQVRSTSDSSDGSDQIVLDTEITPELKLEGQAREIVRAIQEMRKAAGYKVEDRIKVGYDGMEAVFDCFGEEIIAKETLATMQKGRLEDSDAEKEVSVDGEKVTITIKR